MYPFQLVLHPRRNNVFLFETVLKTAHKRGGKKKEKANNDNGAIAAFINLYNQPFPEIQTVSTATLFVQVSKAKNDTFSNGFCH